MSSDDATGQIKLNLELSHRVRRFDQVQLSITRKNASDESWVETKVVIGDESKLNETISDKWAVVASLPEGCDLS